MILNTLVFVPRNSSCKSLSARLPLGNGTKCEEINLKMFVSSENTKKGILVNFVLRLHPNRTAKHKDESIGNKLYLTAY